MSVEKGPKKNFEGFDYTPSLTKVAEELGEEKFLCWKAPPGTVLELDPRLLDERYTKQRDFEAVLSLGSLLEEMKDDAIPLENRWGEKGVGRPENVNIITGGYEITKSYIYKEMEAFFNEGKEGEEEIGKGWNDPSKLADKVEEMRDWFVEENDLILTGIVKAELGMAVCGIIANHPDAYNEQRNWRLKEVYTKGQELVAAAMRQRGLIDLKATHIGVIRAGPIGYFLLYSQEDPELKRCWCYEAKRLPFKDGTFGVGMDDRCKALTAGNIHNRVVEINEIFLASGATIVAFMLDCYTQQIYPKKLKITAPFVDQHGAEMVNKVAQAIGWEVEINGAKLYYSLNDHLYVMVTKEDQPLLYGLLKKIYPNKEVFQAGGDAGDLTEGTITAVIELLRRLGFKRPQVITKGDGEEEMERFKYERGPKTLCGGRRCVMGCRGCGFGSSDWLERQERPFYRLRPLTKKELDIIVPPDGELTPGQRKLLKRLSPHVAEERLREKVDVPELSSEELIKALMGQRDWGAGSGIF